MKVTDYIIDFLIGKGVTDIFGYPGGVICHLMDSATKFSKMKTHTNYNEQGSAFAACGYAQASGKLGVAYSTSGPGATNLVTGIANAYYDSIPTLFLTGQVDTYAEKGDYPVRQRGFQETDVVSITQSITKYAVRVDDVNQIKYCLEKAYAIAFEDNPGPVLLDLPADVQRANVDIDSLEGYEPESKELSYPNDISAITDAIALAKRPLFLVGNGVKLTFTSEYVKGIAERLGIPCIFTMPAFDVFPSNHPLNYGFLGGNGHKYANMIAAKSDLIITIGSRMCIRQIGLAREKFAPEAKLIRIDIDKESMNYKVHEDEVAISADLKSFLPQWSKVVKSFNDYSSWKEECDSIKSENNQSADAFDAKLLKHFSRLVPADYDVTLDVGLNQLLCANHFEVKEGQHVFMSAGHGAMGYSLPAAIGVSTSVNKSVISFCGDGGLMMNVQELQYLKREQLPIKIVCINNGALGMIKAFQERNFNKNYINTTLESGYMTVDLQKLAVAFDIPYTRVSSECELEKVNLSSNGPAFIELVI